MKTIYYGERFLACGDDNAEDVAETLLRENSLYTANSLVIDYARLLVVSGKIQDLEIVWNGVTIPVNEYGAIVNYPEGFADHHFKVAEAILRLAIDKKKKNR